MVLTMLLAALAGPVELPAGTPVEMMVVTEVSASRARPGDAVKLRVNAPVVADGVTVIPVGAPASGEVVAARKSGVAMRRGTIEIRITRLTVGGREVALTGRRVAQGRGGESDDALKLVVAPMWALFAASNSAKLKAGDIVAANTAAAIAFVQADGGGYVIAPPPAY